MDVQGYSSFVCGIDEVQCRATGWSVWWNVCTSIGVGKLCETSDFVCVSDPRQLCDGFDIACPLR